MNTKDTLEQTYQDVLAFASVKVAEGRTPFEVAAALVTIGASIYRTTLNESEYELMMDAISTSRDRVQKLVEIDRVSLQ